MAKRIASLLLRLSRLFDDPQLNSSLCLIFNGMASMIAIIFLILFVLGNRGGLLWLGGAGCICMILANTTDLFPLGLSNLAKRLHLN